MDIILKTLAKRIDDLDEDYQKLEERIAELERRLENYEPPVDCLND